MAKKNAQTQARTRSFFLFIFLSLAVSYINLFILPFFHSFIRSFIAFYFFQDRRSRIADRGQYCIFVSLLAFAIPFLGTSVADRGRGTRRPSRVADRGRG